MKHFWRTAAVVGAALVLSFTAACGGGASQTQAFDCPSPSPSERIMEAQGQGSGSTPSFTTCADWSADLDWRCPDQAAEVTTTVVGVVGVQQYGPFGDGPAGMVIKHYDAAGTYRIQVRAMAACTWTIDVIPGQI